VEEPIKVTKHVLQPRSVIGVYHRRVVDWPSDILSKPLVRVPHTTCECGGPRGGRRQLE
jgi:hypothetical protein